MGFAKSISEVKEKSKVIVNKKYLRKNEIMYNENLDNQLKELKGENKR